MVPHDGVVRGVQGGDNIREVLEAVPAPWQVLRRQG